MVNWTNARHRVSTGTLIAAIVSMKLKLFLSAIIVMLLLSVPSYGQVTYTIHKKCYYRKAKPGKTYTTYHRYHWHTSYEAVPRKRKH